MLPASTDEHQSSKTPSPTPIHPAPPLPEPGPGHSREGLWRGCSTLLGPVHCRLAAVAGTGWAVPGTALPGSTQPSLAATPGRHPRQLSPLPSDLPANPWAGGRGAGADPSSPSICPPLPCPSQTLLASPHRALTNKRDPREGATIPHPGRCWGPGWIRQQLKAAGPEKFFPQTGERLPHILLPAQVNFLHPLAEGAGGKERSVREDPGADKPWEALGIYRSTARIWQEKWLSTSSSGNCSWFLTIVRRNPLTTVGRSHWKDQGEGVGSGGAPPPQDAPGASRAGDPRCRPGPRLVRRQGWGRSPRPSVGLAPGSVSPHPAPARPRVCSRDEKKRQAGRGEPGRGLAVRVRAVGVHPRGGTEGYWRECSSSPLLPCLSLGVGARSPTRAERRGAAGTG